MRKISELKDSDILNALGDPIEERYRKAGGDMSRQVAERKRELGDLAKSVEEHLAETKPGELAKKARLLNIKRNVERLEKVCRAAERMLVDPPVEKAEPKKFHQARGVEVKRDGRIVTFTASTPAIDRHGTRVIPTGIRTERFDQNPIFLWAHDGYPSLTGPPSMDSVIGFVRHHSATASAFTIEVEFVEKEINPRAEMAFQLVKRGALSAVSIGFIPMDWHKERVRGEQITVFDEVELLEVSLVAIPSNSEALATSRGLLGFV